MELRVICFLGVIEISLLRLLVMKLCLFKSVTEKRFIEFTFTLSNTFLLFYTDINERPTSICLNGPHDNHDCLVVGEILIEDLDYPQLQCGLKKTLDLQPYSDKLSEYTCHIEEGEDTLSNTIKVDDHFYVKDKPPKLYIKKSIFRRGDRSYNVPILCRSTLHPLHILSKTLVVDIQGKIN